MNLFYKNLEPHFKKKVHIIFFQLIQTLDFRSFGSGRTLSGSVSVFSREEQYMLPEIMSPWLYRAKIYTTF
jgi:hypothetical protein